MVYFPNHFPNFVSPSQNASLGATPSGDTPNIPSLRNRAAVACLTHATRDFAGQTVVDYWVWASTHCCPHSVRRRCEW